MARTRAYESLEITDNLVDVCGEIYRIHKLPRYRLLTFMGKWR